MRDDVSSFTHFLFYQYEGDAIMFLNHEFLKFQGPFERVVVIVQAVLDF